MNDGGKIRETDERAWLMLDAMPFSCSLWDENFDIIDCNQEALALFGLKDRCEYRDRFFELSPKFQSDGKRSYEKFAGCLRAAFTEGRHRFEWMHQTADGVPLPAEITLVRVKHRDLYIVAAYTRDLREISVTRSKMREADERVQIMLDAMPLCANFWDRNGNNIDCNEEAVKLFELKNKQEYLDRFSELSPEFQPDGRRSSERAAERVKTAFEEGFCRFEWLHQKLNGEPVPAEITLVRVRHREGYIVAGYTRDLRELKASVEKMREADERTRLMLDATPLCCNLWDGSFTNIDCNQEAVTLFELQSKQEYLDRFYELSPEFQPDGRRSAEKALGYIQKAFAEGRCRFEWMHRKLNGEPVPSEITLVRVKYRDSYIVAGYTRDLRELKAMLAEMHKVEEDLRLARDAAEESTKAKSEFLANMSHEIRTPMNGILGLLHLLLKSEVTEKQRDYLNRAEQSAKNLLRIINDILDFSKIEAGKLEMEFTRFTLSEIFEEINNSFAAKIKEKGLAFAIQLPGDLPPLIGDPLRLKQVLINMIGNALKFTMQGEIEVRIRRLHQDKHEIGCEFSVRDTGIGMSDEQRNLLFSPFIQADTSITRRYGGTGLGLAICKQLVEMMDGKIWSESSPKKGSTFFFTAFFQPASGTALSYGEPSRVVRTERDSAPANGARILLVEDNEINQLIARELLTMEGYTVDIADNGQEAVDKLLGESSEPSSYALVLMDIQMPVMDGLTATRLIREHGFESLPIIAMSAHAMSGDREKSLESGMNDHLTKPIDPDILYATLKRWIPRD